MDRGGWIIWVLGRLKDVMQGKVYRIGSLPRQSRMRDKSRILKHAYITRIGSINQAPRHCYLLLEGLGVL